MVTLGRKWGLCDTAIHSCYFRNPTGTLTLPLRYGNSKGTNVLVSDPLISALTTEQ